MAPGVDNVPDNMCKLEGFYVYHILISNIDRQLVKEASLPTVSMDLAVKGAVKPGHLSSSLTKLVLLMVT